jgi:hypothetical protein
LWLFPRRVDELPVEELPDDQAAEPVRTYKGDVQP